jgi:hypothetical protein
MPVKEPGEQRVVRISAGVLERIESFTATPLARREGLDSAKDVIDRACSEFLDRYDKMSGEESYRDLIAFFERNPRLLKRLGYDSTAQLVEAVVEEFKDSRKATVKAKTGEE